MAPILRPHPMTTLTENAVLAALRAVRDPDQGQDIVSLGLVK
ncbi:MAG TPA: iron-sulfur cluster assembly protein, partial [Candidatus Eisenbacteria bacterium]|nr:iron-sulfur cluster assembly protein [Candidatus Eisenbacteria bacterium]